MRKKISEINLIFTSYKEANSFIYQSSFDFTKIKPDYYLSEYKSLPLRLYVSGIGEEYSNKFLARFEPVLDSLIIKVGTSAIVDQEIDILTPFIPQKICFEDKIIDLKDTYDFKTIENIISERIVNKKLLTTKLPLINSIKALEFLNNGYSFVDMETFYFVEKLKENLIIPVLVGTDRGDVNAKRDFLNNISKASLILKDYIIFLLQKIIDKKTILL